MATYQYLISLLPRKWIENENNTINSLYDGEAYDLSIAWQGKSHPSNLSQLLEEILPRGKSWHKDLQLWGDNEHSDIQVWYEHNNVTNITIRIDLRQNSFELVIKFVDLAKKLDCMLLIPDSKIIISPNVSELSKIMLDSDAMKFANDPINFLNKVNGDYSKVEPRSGLYNCTFNLLT